MKAETANLRRCSNCKFCFLEDEGYSNYTVEETLVHCLLKLNPSLPAEDSGLGWDEASLNHPTNRFAETCARFTPGQLLHMDVDHEDEADTLTAAKADPDLWAAWESYMTTDDRGLWWHVRKDQG